MSNYAVRLAQGANYAAASNAAYSFGTGDFTLEAWIRSATGGTVVSRKASAGGSGNGGFLLVVRPDGTVKLATDNGFGFYEVDTVVTPVLDGQWHHLAGVRQNGALTVYVDGQPVQASVRGSLATPLNVNNSLRLRVGATDQQQEPYNQFSGALDEVRVWNVARTVQQLQESMSRGLSGTESGLVGYFTFDYFLGLDYSPVGNNLAPAGNVQYTTPGAPIAVTPASLFHLLYYGRYQTSTRAQGTSGTWSPAPELYVTEDGRFIYQGGLLDGVVVTGNDASWAAGGRNPVSGAVTFMVSGGSSEYWPGGAPAGNLFQGWLQAPGAAKQDFRGQVMDTLGPCSFIQSPLNGLFLDAGAATAGARVVLQPLAGMAQQHFCLTEDGCVAHMTTGLVLDLQGGAVTAGTAVVLAAHSPGTATQRWAVTGDGHLECAAAPGLVAQVEGANPAAGSGVVLQPAAEPAPASQLWLALANAMFVTNAATGLVLDVSAGAGAAGTPLVAQAARDTDTGGQLWSLAGGYLVSAQSGMVAAIQNGSTQAGARIVLEAMNPAASARQQWDLKGGLLVNTASGLAMGTESNAAGAAVVTAVAVPGEAGQTWSPSTGAATQASPAPAADTSMEATSLSTRSTGGSIPLQISVKTSNDWFAGYDGEVQITLFNTSTLQQDFTLSHSTTHEDPFERGNIDTFNVDAASWYTNVTNVLIHKEQSFIDDWWKVDWVKVYDDTRKTTWVFDFHGTSVSEWASCKLTRIDAPGTSPAKVGKYPGQPLPDWMDHTFLEVDDDHYGTTFFDCAGGHSGTPLSTALTSSGTLDTFVRMATGYGISQSHPWKSAYGTNDVNGVETCGIRASGYQYWDGQCHQMVNRLLYAGAPQKTLDMADPANVPAAYGLSTLMFGPYGADFDKWCRTAGFPQPLTSEPDYVWDYVRKYVPWDLARTVMSYTNTMRGQWANTPAAAPDGPVVAEFVKESHEAGVTDPQLQQLTNLTEQEIQRDEL